MIRRGLRPKSVFPKSLRNHRTLEVKVIGHWTVHTPSLVFDAPSCSDCQDESGRLGNGVGTSQVLAQNIFRLKKVHRNDMNEVCEESTYLVEGALEEIQVAAAHLLAEDDPKLETRYLVRIHLADVDEVGLRAEDSALGVTGVGWVDFRHRDLVGTKDQFQGLVTVILERLRQGQDRIRRIGKPQYEHALQHFAQLPATERPSYTRQVIDCVLNKTPIADLNPNIVLAQAELANLAIPEETISLRAFCLQRDGKGEGSMPKDRNKALTELRGEYAKQYLRKQLGHS